MSISIINSLPQIAFSKNPVAVTLQTDLPIVTTNLKIVVQLYVESVFRSGQYSLATQQELPPDSSGNATFYFNSIIDAYFDKHNFPNTNQSYASIAPDCMRRYYIKYAEKSGDPATIGTYTQSNVYYALRGGISFEKYPYLDYFNDHLPVKKSFLTWEENNKIITETQQEYLYFLLLDTGVFSSLDLTLKYTITYTDGTTATGSLVSISSVSELDVVIFPAGFTQLDLGNVNPAKTVKSYKLWVVDSGATVLSEERNYILTRKKFWQTRYYLYTNSLGGVNTLRSTGKHDIELKHKISQANIFVPWDYNLIDGAEDVFYKSEQASLKARTGYQSKLQVDRLRDMLLSTKVVRIVNGRFMPGKITNTSISIYGDNEDLYALAFDFENDFENEVYTPLDEIDEASAGQGDFNSDYNNDFNNQQ